MKITTTSEMEALSDEEKAKVAADTATPRIITKPEEVGNLALGPVVVVHGTLTPLGTGYAHAFGPYENIGEALRLIASEGHAQDHCIKSVIRLIPDPAGGFLLIPYADILSIEDDPDGTVADAKPSLPN